MTEAFGSLEAPGLAPSRAGAVCSSELPRSWTRRRAPRTPDCAIRALPGAERENYRRSSMSTIRSGQSPPSIWLISFALAAQTTTAGCMAEEVQPAEPRVAAAQVEGRLIVNGESVELPHLSVVDKSPLESPDQSLWILFAAQTTDAPAQPVPSKDAAHVEIVITGPRDHEMNGVLEMGGPVQVAHNVKLSENHILLAGGARPMVEITADGPERIEGRVWLDQPVTTARGDTFEYDLRFAASIERRGG